MARGGERSITMQVTCGTKRVGDVEVFYRQAGPSDAPVVLLLHGFPTSSHMFRDLIPALADRYRVIAPDLPGFGHTKVPGSGPFTHSFERMPGAMKCHSTCRSCDQRRIEVDVNSVPLSLTTASGLPRITAIAPSSRATLAPDSDVSATNAKHSRVKSSTTQDAEPPATGKGVRDEVQRPALVRPLRQCHRRSGAKRPFSATAATHFQARIALEPEQLLVVRLQPLPCQQITQTPVAKPSSLSREVTQSLTQTSIIRSARHVTGHPPSNADQIIRPTLA
jgi:hypothetical protein